MTVFVTYSRDNSSNEQVYSFVNFLRQHGYDAECDINCTQNESSANLNAIMTRGLMRDKVIVVLSEHYKQKAEQGHGGVYKEYTSICDDLSPHNQKYIFVSFQGTDQATREKIVPKLYGGYEIIDLIQDERNDYRDYPKNCVNL